MINRLRPQRDQRGAILVLSVAGVVVAMIAAGLAIDLGRLAQEGRENQKVADLAALDASRVLPGTSAAIQSAAEAAATRNRFPFTTAGYSITAVEGTKTGNSCVASSGVGKVCVTVKSPFSNVLPYGPGGTTVTRSAVAGPNGAEAEFSVGSSLATLDTSKSVLDPLLGNWLNTSSSLNAVSYTGLASGEVTLLQLQQKLLGMGYSVGSVNGLMNSEIEVADLLQATAEALGSSTAKTEINDLLAATVDASLKMKLREFINVETPGSTNALDTSINVFDIVNGSAQAANGNHFVDVPGISVTLPANLAGLGIKLKVIEPAQVARGPVGTKANNAQVQLQINVDVSVTVLLAVEVLDVSLTYSNASAQAELTSACPSADPDSIAITAQTSALGAAGTATLVGTTYTLGATAGSVTTSPAHTFNYPGDFGTPWRTGAADLGIDTTVTASGGPLNGLVGSTVTNVMDTLDPLLAPVLEPLLQRLGLELAAADVTAIEMYDPPPFCGQAGAPTLLG